MVDTVTQEALELELQEIQGHLNARTRRMRFSLRLEAGFHQHLRNRALDTLKHGWWIILLLYAAIGISTYTEIRLLSYPLFYEGNLRVWSVVFLLEGVVVASLLSLPWLPALHRGYWIYTGLIAGLALSAIIVATSAFPDPYFNQHSSYIVIFIIAIIYSIGGLRFRPAVIACSGAVMVSYLVISAFDLWLDWGFFCQYVLVANIVGMMLCYVQEHRDRIVFLQARLLELEKGKLDHFSHELTRLSREDVLTGLANRRHFNEVFQAEWDRAKREQQALSLLFVDIDHFKLFNDTYGHLEGDRVLSEVGMALKGGLRRPGDMAVRYGGEEFVLLLPTTPEGGALEVAVQVHEAIEALAIPHRASLVADWVTVSVGAATLVPAPEMHSAQLLACADEALYAAKAAGRNCIVVADVADVVGGRVFPVPA